MIPPVLLKQYGSRVIALRKGETVFRQGDLATHFWLVKSGSIRMLTYTADGKEFVQGYFAEGQSFGEPPFFNRLPYPANAEAVEPSEAWKVPHDGFLRLLSDHPEVHLELTKILSGRLVYKAMMLTEIAVEEAEHRLSTLIGYFRKEAGAEGEFAVPFTRRQLAEMTGLRVETVIRTVKAMERKGKLKLGAGGKILWYGKQQPS
jgi:CRP-like cAMP-binding protein